MSRESTRHNSHPGVPVMTAPEVEGTSLDSPIDLAGCPSPEHLVVEGDELMVGDGHSRHVLRRWPLARLREFRLEPLVGSCFLQARLEEGWVDVLRCPGAPDPRLVEVTRQLDHYCRGIRRRGIEDEGGRRLDLPRDQPARPAATVRQLLRLLRPARGRLLLLLLFSIAATAIELAPPMLQKVLVDRVLTAHAPRSQLGQLSLLLAAVVLGLLLVRLAAVAVAIAKGWLSSQVGTRLTADLRDGLVKKLTELPLAFHDRQQVGALMSRAAYDTETLHTLVYHLTGGFLLQLFQLIGIGVALVWLNQRLALIAMLPMPLIIIGSWYFTRHLNPRHAHYWEAVGRQASALTGMLSGIRVVKSFAQEARESARFQEVSARLRDSRRTVDVSTSTFTALVGLVFALGVLGAWFVGGRDVLLGGMTLGALMAFLQYLTMFYTPLNTLGEATTWISSFTTAMRRVFRLLSARGEAEEPVRRGRRPLAIEGRIEFRGVSFGYSSLQPVLEELSFVVRPGEMIGVVGRSGSGKSTMVSLIGRLYQPDAGRILIDGADLRDLDLHELRRSIGLVPQEPFLFRGTVADNIGYGNPALRPEELLRAARGADAHDFILRRPLAYDTQLEEGGANLSGGERQRLSIARALAYDPAILILDEATASVDAESEQAICTAIRRFARRRTSLVIAHRLSTLRDADRLLVLDRGRLVEHGTHQELLAAGGVYATLANLQRSATAGHPSGVASSSQESSSASLTKLAGQSEPDWLDPVRTTIERDDRGGIRLRVDGGSWRRAHATRAFPALHQDAYLSLRSREASGREVEVGMIRDLTAWPERARAAVRASLGRRYLLRRIQRIQQIAPQGSGVVLRVLTDDGPARLQLERAAERARPFGTDGLLMVDSQGSYYVVPDRRELPRRQRKLLALYLGE